VALNLNELKELLELISERDITEFEMEEDGVKLKIKKGTVVPVAAPAPINHPPAALPVTSAPAQDSPAAAAEPAEQEDPTLTYVRSPMVGTFYRAPEPGAPPFVNVGDRIKPGQVMCIIEAMKLMNEIESECAGEVIEIFVENAQPVQYGDKLFSIRASS
jgi:acetyl-CoA carboxylase biotin carboxyl carrier protein